MMESVRFDQGGLRITSDRLTVQVSPVEIIRIDECQMADEVFHGEHPGLTLRRMAVGRIPWRMRTSGLCGLRLWPEANDHCAPVRIDSASDSGGVKQAHPGRRACLSRGRTQLIGICLGFTASDLGRWIQSSPSFSSAWTLSCSTPVGRAKRRW